VVALTQKVRPDRVGTPPRAEYRASRPLALPLLSILIFCGGGFEKRNGRQRRGAASIVGKCKLHEERGSIQALVLAFSTMNDKEQKSFRLDNSPKAWIYGLIAIGSVVAVKTIGYFIDSDNLAFAVAVGIAFILFVAGLIMILKRKAKS